MLAVLASISTPADVGQINAVVAVVGRGDAVHQRDRAVDVDAIAAVGVGGNGAHRQHVGTRQDLDAGLPVVQCRRVLQRQIRAVLDEQAVHGVVGEREETGVEVGAVVFRQHSVLPARQREVFQGHEIGVVQRDQRRDGQRIGRAERGRYPGIARPGKGKGGVVTRSR